jgi:hypothetical protein
VAYLGVVVAAAAAGAAAAAAAVDGDGAAGGSCEVDGGELVVYAVEDVGCAQVGGA